MLNIQSKSVETVTREQALILFVLDYLRGTKNKEYLTELELYKLLYFLETRYFLRFKKRVTTFPFFRNHYWPAIRTSLSSNSSFFKKVKEWKFNKYYLTSKGYTLPFTQDEISLFENTLDKYGWLTASELINLSHQESPYHIASKLGDIDISNIEYQDFDTFEEEHEEISFSPTVATSLRKIAVS